jgi:ribonuclease-3
MPSKLPTDEELEQAQRVLGVRFRDVSLLRTALTHESFLNENPGLTEESNERLEFLGDGALNFFIARRLYELLPDCPEGDLTARRAQVVRRETLARVAKRMGLGGLLVMGRGEEGSGGSSRPSNLADGFEALAGAVLLDRGIRSAAAFVRKWLAPELKRIVAADTPKDPKSRLQELLQSQGKEPPTYRLVSTDGPDDDLRFAVEVIVDGKSLGAGAGRRKIDAQRQSAREALAKLSS